jgi:hypothetical protein
MVSWIVLGWFEMCGNELVVKYDNGLELAELPDRTILPERKI